MRYLSLVLLLLTSCYDVGPIEFTPLVGEQVLSTGECVIAGAIITTTCQDTLVLDSCGVILQPDTTNCNSPKSYCSCPKGTCADVTRTQCVTTTIVGGSTGGLVSTN